MRSVMEMVVHGVCYRGEEVRFRSGQADCLWRVDMTHQHAVAQRRRRRAEALHGPHDDRCVALVQWEAAAPRVEHALQATAMRVRGGSTADRAAPTLREAQLFMAPSYVGMGKFFHQTAI